MTATVQPQSTAPLVAPNLRSRIFGFGSVFGKTIRDSRRAAIAVALFIGVLLVIVAQAIASEFSTPESRQEIGNLVTAVPPILAGLAGRAVNVEALGGYIQYKYGGFFPLVTALWSILALSATLAVETRRGSMEILAASPVTRRRIAIEKVAGHVVMLTLAMVFVFVATTAAGTFGTLPGDEIPVQAAFGFAAWLWLTALVAGSLAFALAPFVGRGSAAGIAGAVMFAGFLLNGYQTAIPELAPFANLTWFGWTTNHLPLAGAYDWASLLLVAAVTVVLLGIGVAAFVRRDIGQTSTIPTPSLPRALKGLRGPTGRTFAELLPTALAWGIGLGVFGLVMGSSARSFVEQIGESPAFTQLINQVFPDIDLNSPGAFLQLVFIEFGLILSGLAAATLVGIWASDESSGRTEIVLATPLSRRRWLGSGGIAVLLGIAAFVGLTMLGIGLGGATVGGDLLTPIVGTLSLALYAAALAGIGIAVAGLVRAGIAGPVVALVTILTWLFDFLGPALSLPDPIQQLALSSHLGQPMIGIWDPGGIVACLVLAVGGIALGLWGIRRRDLGR
jgi:ABC-2 type transport system permease protein